MKAWTGKALSKWAYYPISTLPRALDVIWCHFPFHTTEGLNPGPYSRPALVKSIAVNGNMQPEVQVVYGTSKLKMGRRPYDFYITKASEMAHAGCSQATRFDLDNVLWLPWSEEFFTCREGLSTPVVGCLSSAAKTMLKLVIEQRKKR